MKNGKIRKQFFVAFIILAMTISLLSGKSILMNAATEDDKISSPVVKNGIVTWDTIYLGNYWISDTNHDGVVDQEDDKQPIRFRVLSVDGDDAFLVSEQSLDVQQYNKEYRAITWEDSTLRKWLNESFMKEAFSTQEQNAIPITKVINTNNPIYGTLGGNDTKDQIFLLSMDEVSNPDYGFDSSFAINSDTRVSLSTGYVSTKDLSPGITTGEISPGTSHCWWLRSPGHVCTNSSIVGNDGKGYAVGNDAYMCTNGVRPALHLSLSSGVWTKGETVSSKITEEMRTPEPEMSSSPEPTKTPEPEMSPSPEPTKSPEPSETPFKQQVLDGKIYIFNSMKYKVTKTANDKFGMVTCIGTVKSKKATSLTIANTIIIEQKTYLVTEVSNKSFKNFKKLKKVIIGNSVTSIGKEAFLGCKSLKSMTIKSKGLKSVGKNAIKGINKNATIQVPSSKIKAYKKLFKSSTGYKKTMKVRK